MREILAPALGIASEETGPARWAGCRSLWETWTPSWSFDAAEFERAAPAWANHDWAEISAHADLHRWREADGDPAYEELRPTGT